MAHLPDPVFLPPRSLDRIRRDLKPLADELRRGGHDMPAYLVEMALLEIDRTLSGGRGADDLRGPTEPNR